MIKKLKRKKCTKLKIMASLEFELAPSESPVSEIISLTTAPRNH